MDVDKLKFFMIDNYYHLLTSLFCLFDSSNLQESTERDPFVAVARNNLRIYQLHTQPRK